MLSLRDIKVSLVVIEKLTFQEFREVRFDNNFKLIHFIPKRFVCILKMLLRYVDFPNRVSSYHPYSIFVSRSSNL